MGVMLSPRLPLADPLAISLAAPEAVKNWGRTLVVAPHPDDETLGCGGAIALLRRFARPVSVVVMSDGTLSHPNSKSYPAPALRDLREKEAAEALRVLGVGAAGIRYLRYQDRSVPHEGSENFALAVNTFAEILRRDQPHTVLLPWRRDPHPDHFAANQIVTAARRRVTTKPGMIEYPVWLWESAEGEDAPAAADGVRALRLDISPALAQKQLAIAAHRSQVSDLIADDPTGFRLTPELLRHFARGWEIYFESTDG